MTILDQLADHARTRVRRDKELISSDEMRRMAYFDRRAGGERFYDAIRKPGLSITHGTEMVSGIGSDIQRYPRSHPDTDDPQGFCRG